MEPEWNTVECRYNVVQFYHDNIHVTGLTAAELKSNFELTTYTPYLALTGELWGVCCEDFEENWPCYNATALFVGSCDGNSVSKYDVCIHILMAAHGTRDTLIFVWYKYGQCQTVCWSNEGLLLNEHLGVHSRKRRLGWKIPFTKWWYFFGPYL